MRFPVAPLLLLVIAGSLGIGTAGAAPLPTITADPGYGPPLTTVQVTGRAFCTSCGPVALSVSALNVDTAPVRADGTFSRVVRIPGSTRPGAVTIAATQGTATARTTFTVTVFQPAPTTYPAPKTVPAPGNLPSGGASGTQAQTTAAPTPGPSTASPRPSSGTTSTTTSPNASGGQPTTVSPAADQRSSANSSAWPIAAIVVLAALLAAGGTFWWRRRHQN